MKGNGMRIDKDNFDRDAEREGIALKQQGCTNNQQRKRQRKEQEYNITKFNKLFKKLRNML